MAGLSERFEQRPVGAVFSSIRSRKQLPFPSGPQYTESAQESAIVDQLAFSPYVLDLITQAVVCFVHDGDERRYSADIVVDYRTPDGTLETFMVEAKRQEDIEANKEKNKMRFAAAKRWCVENDASFCLLDERDIKTTYLANVRRLAEAKASVPSSSAREAVLALSLGTTSTVASAQTALEAAGLQAATAIIAIEKAIVDRDVHCDLTRPFGPTMALHRGLAGTRPESSDPFLATLRRAAKRERAA